MKKNVVVVLVFALAASVGLVNGSAHGADGKALFGQHCAVCHPDGGNIINPKKTLKRGDLTANGISGPAGIVKTMRNPGPGMRVFTEAEIPPAEADAIAGYVWETLSP